MERNPETAPLFVSFDETARLLGISRTAVNRAVDDGLIPSLTLNGRRLIPLAHLQAMADQTMAAKTGAQ